MPGQIHILTFHGLGIPERPLPNGEARYWLDPSVFEAILDCVRDRPDVFITFDDSNSSDFKIALPALVKRKMRATFFQCSERIGLPGFLTADQLRQLANSGMAIGSHGTRHRPWATLDAGDLAEELNSSRHELEALIGRPIEEAACPFGSYNRRVLRSARAAGYRKIYTSDQGPANPQAWILPRNTITQGQNEDHVGRLVNSRNGVVSGLFRKAKFTVKRLR